MIKTMQITSLAVFLLASGMFLFPAAFGVKSNKELEELLKAPNAVEKYQQTRGQKDNQKDDQVPPLVKQAKSFALYLNPPPKKPDIRPRPKAERTKPKPKPKAIPETRPKAEVTAKFKLIGTVHYPSKPQLSMALIDQPGKGLSWVNQGQELNHLIFKDIKDGIVTLQDGKETRQIQVPKRPEEERINNLLEKGKQEAEKKDEILASQVKPRRKVSEVSPEKKKKIKNFISQLSEAEQVEDKEEEKESQKQMIKEFFSKFSSSRIEDEEANKLRDLGKTLDESKQRSEDARTREPSQKSGTRSLRGRISPGSSRGESKTGSEDQQKPQGDEDADRKQRIEELRKLLQKRREQRQKRAAENSEKRESSSKIK